MKFFWMMVSSSKWRWEKVFTSQIVEYVIIKYKL